MAALRRVNDAVHWHISDLTSRIVAESGIPTDRFHLGKMLLQSYKDDPNFIAQINGATHESETSGSLLRRSVRCANCFRNMGLERGDVIVIMAPNHLDLAVPFYAALYLGIAIAPIDRHFDTIELRVFLNVNKPKVIFCQSEEAPDIQYALDELDMNAQIVTFDKGDYLFSLKDLLEKYDDGITVENFKTTDFDPDETIAFLLMTSGTTALPKIAALTHKNLAFTLTNIWLRYYNFPTPTRMALVCSSLQWLTMILHCVMAPIMRYTRLQTPKVMTQEHAYELINTYRPTFTIISPFKMTMLLKPGDRDRCDFSCFEYIMVGGSVVSQALIDQVKEVAPNSEVFDTYGMTELSGLVFVSDSPPPGSCGKPIGNYQYRIVDFNTLEDIQEPNVRGELWMKGPGVIKGYYNNPEATADAFAEDGWFRTGDMFYSDENWNFFYVERIKLNFRIFRGTQAFWISPLELEGVIQQHPGVREVAVTSIPDPKYIEVPVALIVPQIGYSITKQDIKDLVKESLADYKRLRGGVIFINEIPLTVSSKIHRRKIKELAMEMKNPTILS